MPETEKKVEEKVDRGAVTELSAVLERLVEEDKVDDSALKEIDNIVSNLNDKTKAAIMDLPVIQKLSETAAQKSTGRPGETVSNGLFSSKVPYSKGSLYEIFGTEESWTCPETIDVIPPGGWVFKLKAGFTYDIPRDKPLSEVPEDHGYQLPKIVVALYNQRVQQLRQNRRDTELKPFGQGVRFLQTGWAGKDSEVARAAAAPHPTPTDE